MKTVIERIMGINEFDVEKKVSFICEELQKSHSHAFNEILSMQLIQAEFGRGSRDILPFFIRNDWPALQSLNLCTCT